MSDKKYSIDYTSIVHQSMFYIIKMALKEIQSRDLNIKNYFYINFLTTHKDVIISKSLKNQYPDIMTIVLQHDFKELHVLDDFFKITLSFNGSYSSLVIPYQSIINFKDPSQGFELEFKQNTSSTLDDHHLKHYSKVRKKDKTNDDIQNNNIILLEEFIKSDKNCQ